MMKLSKLCVIALLAGTLGVVGCSDDPPTGTGGTGGGGTGGGGTGGTGGGGTGGTGGGVAEPCTEGNCVADSEPETLCKDAIVFCNLQSAPTSAQCDEFGNLFCEQDFEGATPEEVCEFCDTDNPTAIRECVDAYTDCQDSLEECVVLALAACRTGRVPVFVTSDTFDGNLGGLIGADEKCQAAADAESLSGTYTAWISDNDSDARDRIRDGEYRLISGTLVANDKADLTDGSLSAAINGTENSGTTVVGNVWTATDPTGVNPGVGSCQEWTTGALAESGRVGDCTATDATWTDLDPGGDQGGNTCEKLNRLYCFSDTTSN